MKVLWFSVTPLSLDAGENTGVEGKGWIGALLQTALRIEGIEITVAYANISPERKETEERAGLRIVPINVSRYSKREIIKDMMTKKEVDITRLLIVQVNKPNKIIIIIIIIIIFNI